MPLNKTVKRELEVAFSKHAQPAWFRVTKYVVLAITIYFLRGTKWLWIVLIVLFSFAMLFHFWYRYKTKRWTQSYGLWKHDKEFK